MGVGVWFLTCLNAPPQNFKNTIAMKLLLLLVAAILAVANAKPWLQIEFEEPIKPDSKDCSVYYNRNYPMQCAPGLLFHPVSLTCELEEVVKVERTDISC